MNKSDLDKLTRIAESVRELAALVSKLQSNDNRVTGFPQQYISYHEVIEPIVLRNIEYQLEFYALPKRENLSFGNVTAGLVSLRGFLDGVVKQETIGSQTFTEQVKEELFIDDNKPLSAYKTISDITSKSVKTLKMIDNYLDVSSIDFFLSVNTKVNINVLTMQLKPNKPALKTAIGKFLAEWGGTVFEVKTTNYFHDRYVIIDDLEVWHLGPSLNRLGIKPAMISKIQDQDIAKHIIDLFKSQWTVAVSI